MIILKRKPGRFRTKMSKIEELTPEQETLLIKHREEYLAWGLSCEPLNKKSACDAIGQMYEKAGKKKPYFWICQSPLQTNIVITVLKNIKKDIGDNLMDNLRENLEANISAYLGDNLEDNLMDNLGENLGENLGYNLGENLETNLRDNLWNNLWA